MVVAKKPFTLASREACGPPEKLSLTLVPRSYVLRMIVNLLIRNSWNARFAWRSVNSELFKPVKLDSDSRGKLCVGHFSVVTLAPTSL